MNAFGYIESKVLTRIKPSKVEGVGVFAIRDIPSSSFIFEPWLGETGYHPVREEDLLTLPRELYKHIKGIFLFGPDFPKNTDTYVYLVKGCHWIYTNPGCFINSGGALYNIDKDTVKTIRNIKAGEEILSNYGKYERINKKYLL